MSSLLVGILAKLSSWRSVNPNCGITWFEEKAPRKEKKKSPSVEETENNQNKLPGTTFL